MKKLSLLALSFLFLWSCSSNSEESSSNTDSPNDGENTSQSISKDANDNTEKVSFIGPTSKYNYAADKAHSGTVGDAVDVLKIDDDFTSCTESENTRGDIVLEMPCYIDAYRTWEDALNYKYQTALNDLEKIDKEGNHSDRAVLVEAQTNWEAFRTAEQDFLSALYQSLDETRTPARATANTKNLNIIKQRAFDMIKREGTEMKGDDVHAFVQREQELEDKYNTDLANCYANKEASNMELLGCLRDAGIAIDKLLNENYKKLKGALSEDLQSKLKATQKAWIKHRDAELEVCFMMHKFSMQGNSFTKEQHALKNVRMLHRRATELGEFTKAVTTYSK